MLATVFTSMPGVSDAVYVLLPTTDPSSALLVTAVGAIGMVTLAYTLLGGMMAVIWTDVVQLCVYLVGMVVVGAFVTALLGRKENLSFSTSRST